MSRYVRTLQVRSVPSSYYGEETTEFGPVNHGQIDVPILLTGIGPLVLALVAISLFILLRPQVKSDQLLYRSVSSEAIVGSENLDVEETIGTGFVTGTQSRAAEGATSTIISSLFTPEVLYWSDDIAKWAQMYEVDPNVVATIMQIESCGDPRAASYAGAQGLFQVMPFHFTPGEDMLDPDINAMRGLAFYKEQMRYTGGDRYLSFAGYNGGYAASGGNYADWPAETQRYFYWAKGIYEAASAGATSSAALDEWLAAGGAGGCQRAAAYLGI